MVKRNSLLGQTVDIGSGNIPASIHTAHISAKLIIKNKEDIGFLTGYRLLTPRNIRAAVPATAILRKVRRSIPFLFIERLLSTKLSHCWSVFKTS